MAGLLRLWHLDAGWFGVDQARDVRWAELIASGSAFPTVGPLMRNRFHLGATYYYVWAIGALWSSSPLALYAYAALLGTATVAATFVLGRIAAGPAAGLAAAAVFATSPIAVVDARIAWAPAALPPWSAAVLLAAAAFLWRPTAPRGALLAFVAALGTQLHLAALPPALVATSVLLLRARVLSARGLALCAVAGLLPLVPMLLAWTETVAAVPAAPASGDPRAGRLLDILLAGRRVLVGLTPPGRPTLAELWIAVEGAATALTIAAALVALLRPPRAERASTLRVVACFYLASLGAVAVLPVQAWYYYLDATLVPGAVLLGVAWRAVPRRGPARAGLAAVVAARAALLLWWVNAASAAGFVPANLDFLRLGGGCPEAPEARARLLGVATKREAAAVLAGELGIPLERSWRDVHGSGFGDLDTDNGYFLRRAAAGDAPAARPHDVAAAAPAAKQDEAASAPADDRDGNRTTAASALVTYRGDFPPSWVARLGPARDVGPLEVRPYRPALGTAALEGCGGGAVPEAPPPAPLDYGSGEPTLPVWPCARPVVSVPVEPAATGTVLRVFARVVGRGRVLALEADPAGTPVVSSAPGAGPGLELAPGPARVRVTLAVDGPARLDLYELQGVR